VITLVDDPTRPWQRTNERIMPYPMLLLIAAALCVRHRDTGRLRQMTRRGTPSSSPPAPTSSGPDRRAASAEITVIYTNINSVYVVKIRSDRLNRPRIAACPSPRHQHGPGGLNNPLTRPTRVESRTIRPISISPWAAPSNLKPCALSPDHRTNIQTDVRGKTRPSHASEIVNLTSASSRCVMRDGDQNPRQHSHTRRH